MKKGILLLVGLTLILTASQPAWAIKCGKMLRGTLISQGLQKLIRGSHANKKIEVTVVVDTRTQKVPAAKRVFKNYGLKLQYLKAAGLTNDYRVFKVQGTAKKVKKAIRQAALTWAGLQFNYQAIRSFDQRVQTWESAGIDSETYKRMATDDLGGNYDALGYSSSEQDSLAWDFDEFGVAILRRGEPSTRDSGGDAIAGPDGERGDGIF